MLNNTFCHIPRITLNKERALWEKGILTWSDYRNFSPQAAHIDESEKQLQERKPGYFSALLKSDQQWRLFPDFRNTIAYIDIETTGLRKGFDDITTIALFDGTNLKTYVNGQNLAEFPRDIQDYQVIVTFNGKTFDVPFIEKYFGIVINHAHIDLRYVLRALGYTGGLKAIEQKMGIDRGELRAVDGAVAIYLWHHYQRRGCDSALETLLAYNCEDVVNLEILMIEAFNLNVNLTPFKGLREIPQPAKFNIPFKADKKLIQRY